jgi:hypothetical protein
VGIALPVRDDAGDLCLTEPDMDTSYAVGVGPLDHIFMPLAMILAAELHFWRTADV